MGTLYTFYTMDTIDTIDTLYKAKFPSLMTPSPDFVPHETESNQFLAKWTGWAAQVPPAFLQPLSSSSFLSFHPNQGWSTRNRIIQSCSHFFVALFCIALFTFRNPWPKFLPRKDLASCQRQHKQEMAKYNKLMREKTKYDSEVKNTKAQAEGFSRNIGVF